LLCDHEPLAVELELLSICLDLPSWRAYITTFRLRPWHTGSAMRHAELTPAEQEAIEAMSAEHRAELESRSDWRDALRAVVLWRKAEDLARRHPRFDPSDLYHCLCLRRRPPGERLALGRLRAGLWRNRRVG
jgi:hypothetical protein